MPKHKSTGTIAIFRVNFDRRPDLAEQYHIARSPALVLLDAEGKVVWKQDIGITDEAPLDLVEAQNQINALLP